MRTVYAVGRIAPKVNHFILGDVFQITLWTKKGVNEFWGPTVSGILLTLVRIFNRG